MTQGEVREKIEGDAAKRVKDVRRMAMIAQTTKDEFVRFLMMQACMVLSWGHLEGFVKNSSRMLITFLEDEGTFPLRLSKIFPREKRNMDMNHLTEIIDVLGLDNRLFLTKKAGLSNAYRLRNDIAHGADSQKIQSDLRIEMTETIAEAIQFFAQEILKVLDNN